MCLNLHGGLVDPAIRLTIVRVVKIKHIERLILMKHKDRRLRLNVQSESGVLRVTQNVCQQDDVITCYSLLYIQIIKLS